MSTRLPVAGPQLLIDDHLVDDIWMIRRSPELPVKSLAEKFVTDDLIVVDRLPVTDHDLTLSRDTVDDQHDRLGWSEDEERPDAAGDG